MIILMSSDERNNRLNANGFMKTNLEESGIEVWTRDGKNYTVPSTYEETDKYCRLAFDLFLKRNNIPLNKNIETQGMSDRDYLVKQT